jgi:hypothetical protein
MYRTAEDLERIRNELRNQFTEQEIKILRAMTPEKRLQVSFSLYRTVYQLKKAWLQKIHPDWTHEQIDQALREAFLYGQS